MVFLSLPLSPSSTLESPAMLSANLNISVSLLALSLRLFTVVQWGLSWVLVAYETESEMLPTMALESRGFGTRPRWTCGQGADCLGAGSVAFYSRLIAMAVEPMSQMKVQGILENCGTLLSQESCFVCLCPHLHPLLDESWYRKSRKTLPYSYEP